MERPLGSAGPPPSVQRSEWAFVGGATLLATVLSGWGIGAKSLWRDERYTVSTALRPWGSLVDLSVQSETNGFVHAFALRAFSEIGTTESALRALSALCFVATVPMAWLVARRLVKRRAAIIATLLVATHGGLLAFGQTVRAYAMVVLVASVLSWLFLLDIEEARRWKSRRGLEPASSSRASASKPSSCCPPTSWPHAGWSPSADTFVGAFRGACSRPR